MRQSLNALVTPSATAPAGHRRGSDLQGIPFTALLHSLLLLSFISSCHGLLYHLVSHSSRSLTMRFCRRSCDDALPAAGETPKAGDWLKVRRFYIRSLRCQTRSIILLLALTEALKKGPLELVYAGRKGFPPPGENDYGVS